MEATIKDGKLTVVLNISEAVSSTGKTVNIASTGGFRPLGVKYKDHEVKCNVVAGYTNPEYKEA